MCRSLWPDAATLTKRVTGNVGNIIQKLFAEMRLYDVQKQREVVYIEVIDKDFVKSGNPSLPTMFPASIAQRALLKRSKALSPRFPPQGGRKHPQREFLQVDTSKILFICGGALPVWIK